MNANKGSMILLFLDTVYILLETLVEVSTDKYTQQKSESGIPISQVKAEQQLRWL